MKIPYANPNLGIPDFIRALFISDATANKEIKTYFSNLTGKKHILITNSCRSALFLAYTAIEAKGEVITTPLTCKVAIDAIVESGNTAIFADINLCDLNIQPGDIEHRVNDKTIAIQAIHLGGVSCDMLQILSIARKNKLLVIEDCAQSLGAVSKGKLTGSFGDVACFSLIKNAYGIGGGILATDDYEIFQRAESINNTLDKTSLPLVLFRVARNLLDTKRKYRFVFPIYRLVMSLRGGRQSYKSVHGQLCRVSSIEKKIAAHQINRLDELHEKRKKTGKKYCELLIKHRLMLNHRFDVNGSSFTKLFVYHPAINSRKHLKVLGDQGIEAMHLEQKYGSPFQERLVPTGINVQSSLQNYHKAHDCLVSLPLFETMPEKHLKWVVNTINLTIKT